MVASSQNQIIYFICTDLNVPFSKVFAFTRLTDDLHLDEIDRLLLIAALEMRFNIFLSEEEFDSIETVGDASLVFMENAA